MIDGHISIHWMDQQHAPKALLQFISCNCLKGHCVVDGSPTKTAKSALLHILEEKAQPVEDVPASAVWILDGVAILHSMKDVPMTFM